MDHSRIKTENIIERAVLKQLSHDEKENFRKHLLNCDECRKELFRTKLLLSAAGSIEQNADNKKLTVSFFIALFIVMLNYTKKHAVAISAVTILILCAVVLELQYDFISSSGTDEIFADNAEAFTRNKYLEGNIESNLRSANQLNITSPKTDCQFYFDKKNGIPFTLSATMEGAKDKEMVVKVFSNTEADYLNDSPLYIQKVTRATVPGKTGLSLQKQLYLKKGLYYYVLQYSNEIDYIYVGRFWVR